jgi:hypothetical protein
MYTSESITELLPALLAARKRFRPVVKESSAQIRAGQPYHYADLQTVIDSTMPALVDNNLLVLQVIDAEQSQLVTRLAHVSGQWVESRFPLNFDQGPQHVGSALTYGRRYSLLALLCVAAEDDDGASAQQAAPSPARRAGSPRTITERQVDKLYATAHAHGWTDDDVAKHLAFRYKVTSSAEIKMADFDELLKLLEGGPAEVF